MPIIANNGNIGDFFMKNKIVQTIQEYVIIALGCTIMAAGVVILIAK